MSKTIIQTQHAPAAVGPYSQATTANGFIFTAGQIPLVPGTKEFVTGDITAMTVRCLENIKAILHAAGSDMQHIVKTTIFLADMDDFPVVNAAYANYFESDPPARSTVAVATLPLNAQIEIEAIALIPE